MLKISHPRNVSRRFRALYLVNHFLLNTKRPLRVRAFLYYSTRSLREGRIDISRDSVIRVHGNMKMITMANDRGISTELLTFGMHEPLVTRLIKRIVARGMVCLDVGSNIGYYALLEGRIVGEKGKVIAIEPSSRNHDYLQRNIDLNGLTNVKVNKFAVGDTDTVVTLETGSRSNLTRVVEAQSTSKETEKVISKKIDSFVSESRLERIDILRMDIEGHECNSIIGAKHTLAKWRPAIVVEVHKKLMGLPKTIQMLELLQELGYEVLFFIPRQRDYPYLNRRKDTVRTSLLKLIGELKTGGKEVRSNTFTLYLQHPENALLN